MEEEMDVSFVDIGPDLIGAKVEISTPLTNYARDEEVDERLMNDTNHLLTIFPEDLWRTIMDTTTDPQILESFCNVSPFFRNILDKRRSHFLFGKVWEIIESDFTDDTEDDYIKLKRKMEDEDFKRKFETNCVSCGATRCLQTFSSILNLRLVCKSWCAGIDAFNQNHPRHFRMDAEATYEDDFDWDYNNIFGWSNDSFDRESDCFEKFLKHFGDTHGSKAVIRNPFMSRSFDFDMCSLNPLIPGFQSEFTETVKSFLRKYGQHIWYCNLYWNVSVSEYAEIREWLFLMPNLKVLKLVGTDLFRKNAEFRRELLEYLESHPNLCILPQFKNLQFLYTSDLPQITLEELLRKNSQISKLLVGKENRLNLYDLNGIQLPNLKHFCHKICTEEEFQRFQISETNWPLTNVYLNFKQNINIQWTNLFTFLHRWGSTIESLNIRFANEIPITDDNKTREFNSPMDLKFPNLKNFKLIMYYFTSLDFLLLMKDTLEILDICVLYKTEEEKVEKSIATEEAMQNQTVQFLGYQDKLLESNIWKLFPKLKLVFIFECDKTFEWDHRDIREFWIYDRVDWVNDELKT